MRTSRASRRFTASAVCVVTAVILFISWPSSAQQPPPQAPPPPPFPLGIPFELRVPVAPMPFAGDDGRTYLVYELHVTNFAPRDLPLQRLDVLSGDTPLAIYKDPELAAMISFPGAPPPEADVRPVPSGRRAIAFIWIALQKDQTVPASLRHRIVLGDRSLEGAAVQVSTARPIVIGPPLRGSNWVAANGPSRASGHRRALIPIDGMTHIAQRFAIDWVQLNDAGNATFTGDQRNNRSYSAYGQDVLAVADATVAALKDGIPENIPGPQSRAVPITIDTIGGNHVVLDLGGGRYAFYGHMQPGSLRVKVGDRVTRGQVIGLVGNTGNSTEPHLHFHVADGVSPLGSEGLPYVLAGTNGMPLQNSRVTFTK